MKAGEADRTEGALSSGRADAALTTLGRRIASGAYEVGAALPVEADLASELGVSRSTIREAVRSLVTLGMVEVRTRAGTRVRPKNAWNILNQNVLGWMTSASGQDKALLQAIDEAREIFEPQAAALAARRASRSDVAAISRGYEGMAVAVEADDAQAAILADREFHLAILMATDNPILMAFDTAIDAVLGLLFEVAAAEHWEVFRANLENHRRVLEAIRDGNPEEASQAMRDTIGFTRRSLRKHVFIN
ncbi:MAG: FadR family transcriptional regulator [Fulvimarina manganoxydans]|uniref:FadR/GntR family transcriptional regulator n=1 Tax=Fulvimarina manganoxydans TaxID=937218 RepID=UPI0023520741|nr:FadR/GntR family transcriptional regulator [Fulvimarina manganoxydans]MCK5934854.1 FadR family transcriptional regulator [Fulvimarina manganoxydans]